MSKPTLDQMLELHDRIKRGNITAEAIQALLRESRWLDLTQRFRNVAESIIDECIQRDYWNEHFPTVVKGYMFINEPGKALEIMCGINDKYSDTKAACLLEIIRHTGGFMNARDILNRYLWPVYQGIQCNGLNSMHAELAYASYVVALAYAEQKEKALELLYARPHHTFFTVNAFVGLGEFFEERGKIEEIKKLEEKIGYAFPEVGFKLRALIAKISSDPADFETLWNEQMRYNTGGQESRWIDLCEVLVTNPVLRDRPERLEILNLYLSKPAQVKVRCLFLKAEKTFGHVDEAMRAASGIESVVERAKAHIEIAGTTGSADDFDLAAGCVKVIPKGDSLGVRSLLAFAAAKAAREK